MSGAFDALSPEAVLQAVEGALAGAPGEFGGVRPDGSVFHYASYANRVYGLRLEDGRELVAKFYRPGRWSPEALADEHRFVLECAAADIPVVAPLPLADGGTLGELQVEDEGSAYDTYRFALFPKRGGRGFDAESDEDWRRLGGLAARVHLVGESGAHSARAVCDPALLSLPHAEHLLEAGHVHPDLEEAFASICEETLNLVLPLFSGIARIRLHGDCHRGNILDRQGEGLLLIDFDDTMTGPAAQDLWLLLPDRAPACRRELALLLEGYEAWRPFDRRELALIEPLRFMRMIYYLSWRARQRGDKWFDASFPDWGGKSFWASEIESLKEQAGEIAEGLAGS